VAGGDERERGGDDLAGKVQHPDRAHQREGTVGREREVIHLQILGQRRFQTLMERTPIGHLPARPDLLQIGQKVLQRRQERARDVERPLTHDGRSKQRAGTPWPQRCHVVPSNRPKSRATKAGSPRRRRPQAHPRRRG